MLPHAVPAVPHHAERDRLLDEGFSGWSRREFNAFVRACEKYGRNAVADIAREIEGKTEDDVGTAERLLILQGTALVLAAVVWVGGWVAGGLPRG